MSMLNEIYPKSCDHSSFNIPYKYFIKCTEELEKAGIKDLINDFLKVLILR